MRRLLFVLLQFILISHAAAENGNLMSCEDDIRHMLIQALQPPHHVEPDTYTSFDQKAKDGVYTFKLYMPAKPGVSERDMTEGWIQLDSVHNSAYDITFDDENPVKLAIDPQRITNYVAKCLTRKYPPKQAGDAIVTTRMPVRLDGIYDCHHSDLESKQCMEHYHEYAIDWVDADIRKCFNASVDTFFLLPSLGDLKIILGLGDHESALYIFKDSTLLTKEVVGNYTDTSDLRFDINKDYLVTTYLRTGKNITRETKISKVAHEKLGLDGKFLECPKANPACN